jgi:NAD(P)-dependent dehydrogenase (short-subunit alcohol dehydrogenase family)
MASLSGKIAVVTGAARGIGKAIALRFRQEGAKLALVDTLADTLEKTIEYIRDDGGEAIGFQADVTKRTEIDKFVSQTILKFAKIDILVNNAGIGGSKGCLDTTEKDWDRMVNINLKSVFLVCQRVIPEMIKKGGGKIINIASMYGVLGSPHAPAYCASKAGIINLSRQLAVDFSGQNILVNSISPGLIATEMTQQKLKESKEAQRFINEIPVGRHGAPADIAGAALFLAGADSDFITGHNLVVDGGQSCKVV